MSTQSPVFQIVGYKNTGKTSLLSEIIAYGSAKGQRVAAIKHHGHDEPLKVMHHETDSYRLHESGAFMTGVDSPRRFQLEMSHSDGFTLDDLVELYRNFSPDLIVVEGFKYEHYPKAVIIKRVEDLKLLDLTNVQFVITWNENLTSHLALPVYTLREWRKRMADVYRLAQGGQV